MTPLKDAVLADGAPVGGAVVVVRQQEVPPDGRLVGADSIAEQAHAATGGHDRHLGGHQALQLLPVGGDRVTMTACNMNREGEMEKDLKNHNPTVDSRTSRNREDQAHTTTIQLGICEAYLASEKKHTSCNRLKEYGQRQFKKKTSPNLKMWVGEPEARYRICILKNHKMYL